MINPTAIILFLAFVAVTLGITWWAAKRTRSTDDFYAAGGKITGFQNGLAISGDFISAGAFLGLSGLVYASGFDGLVFAVVFAFGALFVCPGLGVQNFLNVARDHPVFFDDADFGFDGSVLVVDGAPQADWSHLRHGGGTNCGQRGN